MSLDKQTWEDLLESIEDGLCTPFIGSQAYTSGIPIATEIATTWAKEHQYPLDDLNELARVSQFLAIREGDNMHPKRAIKRIIKEIRPPDFLSEEGRSSPYAVLTDLNLPIYITTNYDYFMEDALRTRGRLPISEFCRWNEDLYRYATNAGFISIFDKEKEYVPSPTRPLVYHVYGIYDQESTMVLTEKDYIDFVISLNKGDEKISLPTVVRKALATTPLLFVGYRLEDISFRVIFQGVISFLGVKRPKISIAVQLPPNFSDEKKEKAQNYLTQYTKNMFEISVHWGNTDEFMKELHERLDKFRSHRNKK
jgi:hypothetical protein